MMCTHELACGTSNGANDTNDIYTHNIVIIIIIIIYCMRAKEGENRERARAATKSRNGKAILV